MSPNTGGGGKKILETKQRLLNVIKKSLWNTGVASADSEIYEEMRLHAIAPLAAPVLLELGLPEELLKKWEMSCVGAVVNYQRCVHAQAALPISVPYVILQTVPV